MLIIRSEQWDTLIEYNRQRYEEMAYDTFRQRYPDECVLLGEEGLRRRIKTGVRKAESYGITDAPHVDQFIDLMFTWGDDFDVSPQKPWATDVLRWEDASADVKMRQLAINSNAAQEGQFLRKMKRRSS